MAFRSADRVKETSTSTGTGNVVLAGAAVGFRAFSAAVAVADNVTYCIEHATDGSWEIGIGHLSASTTFVRDAVIRSSNADALVNFAAGAKSVFVTTSSSSANARNLTFGDGSTGDVTISGVTALTAAVFYRNLTLVSGARLDPMGHVLYVSGVLDLSTAPVAAIVDFQLNGGAGRTDGLSVAAPFFAESTTYNGHLPMQGGFGGAGAGGTINAAGSAGNASILGMNLGGSGGTSGAGGAGSAGAGGSAVASASLAYSQFTIPQFWRAASTANPTTGASRNTSIHGGRGGSGGASGGGSSTAKGCSGGGGGQGGTPIVIYANVIKRGAGTAAGAIGGRISGYLGTGGAGGDGTGGFIGGGAGGAGGGGGWRLIVYNALAGTPATNLITADGGAGGRAGLGYGSGGVNGTAGNGGNGGNIQVCNLRTGLVITTTGTAGGIGGIGGAGGTCGVTL